MYNFQITDYQENPNQVDFQHTFLWIINSNKTPPHIGISSEGLFYSLKANGKDFQLTAQTVLIKLRDKKSELTLIQLKQKIDFSALTMEYSKYTNAIPAKISCLTPILEVLSIKEKILLPQLLNLLVVEKLISSIFVFNNTRKIITIGNYSEIEIAQEIEKLQHVKRK